MITETDIKRMEIALEYMREREEYFRRNRMFSAALAYAMKADQMEDRIKRYEILFGKKKGEGAFGTF